MTNLLKRSIYSTKDNTYRCHNIFKKLGYLIITALMIAGINGSTANAASGLKIYNYTTKTTSNYTEKKVNVTYNGSAIGNSKYPGILVDGIALLPYYDIFDASDIDADCVYDSKNNTITISKYGITIKMTIGSKKATVNSKTVTLPVAPMKIKYVAANKTKVLVPSRFVCETLGLGYTWYSDKSTVAIEKYTLSLSYNGGEKFEYSKARGKVIVNGKSVNLGKTPSLIINNTAMLCAYKVFASTSIGAKYTYNYTNQTITFTKGSNTLVMTVGSKKAYLNNNLMSLSAAPVYVTNYDSGTSYVMVPGSFTACCLGFDYIWNNTTKTSIITSQKSTSTESENSGKDPELGDSGDIIETGTVLNQWTAPDTEYGVSSGVHTLESTFAGNTGSITAVTRDYSSLNKNSETFMFVANAPFYNVTSNNSGKIISIQADTMSCAGQTYQLYQTSSNLINTISLYNHPDTSSSTMDIEVLQDNYKYDISFSADKQILYVTVYNNAVTSAIVGTNGIGDYLTLSGIYPLKWSITEASDLIYIDLPYTTNCLGDLNAQLQGSEFINQIFSVKSSDKTQLVLELNKGYQYYSQENGNQLTIEFQPKNSTDQTDTTTVIDKSNYQIVIPKPSDLTSDSITNEDYYFSHYFVICLKGNYSDFFDTHSISNNAKTVSKISVDLTANGNTKIKLATTKLQGYEIAYDKENIYVKVGNPRDIYKNIVVLDPGHGGAATGAIKNGYYEKNLNLKILYTLGKKYFNQDTSKLKVYYTRTSDVDMTLTDRAAFASKVGADLFVSLHMNSAEGAPNACGTEVFYSHYNNTANNAGLTSKALASYFVQNITNNVGTSIRGVKDEAFVVVKKNTVPAVLIELGFLTNKNDFSIIKDEAKQDMAAKSIYQSLLQVFEQYPTGR